jgi:hypothetical protein
MVHLKHIADALAQFDAKESERGRRKGELAAWLEIAQGLQDAPSIDVTAAQLAQFEKAESRYREERSKLEAAVAVKIEADERCRAAQLVEDVGTSDPKQALRNHEAVVVARAKARHLEQPLEALFAATKAALDAFNQTAFASLDRQVVEETRAFSRDVLENRPTTAREAADAAGKTANAAKAAFWLVAEEVARQEFKPRLAELQRVAEDTGVRGPDGRFVKDRRREEPDLPTLDDLERLFTRRRNAFAAERQRLEAQIAALNGALSNLGGAK